jgi:hypothetical protein
MPKTPKLDLPEVLSGFQALAWIAWRTEKAVKAFSGPDAEDLWDAARAGKFPDGLGQPKVTPIAAEQELNAAMRSGELKPHRRR